MTLINQAAIDSYERATGARYKKSHYAHYNTACIYSITGKLKEARKSLIEAADHGYKSFNHMAKDKDLKNLRAAPGWKNLFASLKKRSGVKNLAKVSGCYMSIGYRMQIKPYYVAFSGPMDFKEETYTAVCHTKKLKISGADFFIDCKDGYTVKITNKGKFVQVTGYKTFTKTRFKTNLSPGICAASDMTQ